MATQKCILKKEVRKLVIDEMVSFYFDLSEKYKDEIEKINKDFNLGSRGGEIKTYLPDWTYAYGYGSSILNDSLILFSQKVLSEQEKNNTNKKTFGERYIYESTHGGYHIAIPDFLDDIIFRKFCDLVNKYKN